MWWPFLNEVSYNVGGQKCCFWFAEMSIDFKQRCVYVFIFMKREFLQILSVMFLNSLSGLPVVHHWLRTCFGASVSKRMHYSSDQAERPRAQCVSWCPGDHLSPLQVFDCCPQGNHITQRIMHKSVEETCRRERLSSFIYKTRRKIHFGKLAFKWLAGKSIWFTNFIPCL